MEPGTRTVCPVCYAIHVLGARLGAPRDKRRFCSMKCEVEAQDMADKKRDNRQTAEALDALSQHAANLAKAANPVRIWCHSCLLQGFWCPALDGSDCPECGYKLSLYGPFEQMPTLGPTPKPLKPSWHC